MGQTHVVSGGPTEGDDFVVETDKLGYFGITKTNASELTIAAGVVRILNKLVTYAGGTLDVSLLADNTYKIFISSVGVVSASAATETVENVQIGQVVVAGGLVMSFSEAGASYGKTNLVNGAPAAGNIADLSALVGDVYLAGMYATDDLSVRTAADSEYVKLNQLDVTGGAGDEWPIVNRNNFLVSAGADIGGAMCLYGYIYQEDGSAITSGMYANIGYIKIEETDEADTADGYVCGVLGIYNTSGVNPVVPVGTPGCTGVMIAAIKDNANSKPQGAFVAFMEGDATATVCPAAFKALNARSAGAAGFEYGLDLTNADSVGVTIAPAGYDIRLQGGGTVKENATNQFEASIPAFFQGYVGSAGNPGISGVLMWDDGANYRITLTFEDGLLVTEVIAASSGAGATWT